MHVRLSRPDNQDVLAWQPHPCHATIAGPHCIGVPLAVNWSLLSADTSHAARRLRSLVGSSARLLTSAPCRQTAPTSTFSSIRMDSSILFRLASTGRALNPYQCRRPQEQALHRAEIKGKPCKVAEVQGGICAPSGPL